MVVRRQPNGIPDLRLVVLRAFAKTGDFEKSDRETRV